MVPAATVTPVDPACPDPRECAPVPRFVPTAVRVVAVLTAALLLSACQVRLASDLGVNPDGSGTLTVTVAIDQELWESLTADDFDPFAGLTPLTEAGWTSEAEADDGGQRLEIRTDFTSPADLAAKVAELHEGLDEEDPRILADPVLEVDDDRASLSLRAGLVPPTSTGIEGDGIRFDGEDLAALLAERGDEVFRYDLRVTMPGPIESSDADEVDGRSATWHLPADGMRDVTVSSQVAAGRTLLVAGAAGLLAFALVGVTVVLVRRRR